MASRDRSRVVALARSAAAAGTAPWSSAAGAWWDPPAVRRRARTAPGRGGPRRPAGADPAATGPGTELTPLLDGAGTLAGQRLSQSASGAAGTGSTSRPNRSRPVRSDGVVLVGADDGHRSRLRAIDVARRLRVGRRGRGGGHPPRHREPGRRRRCSRCAWTGATRADLGIWRRSLDRQRPAAPDPAGRSRRTGGSGAPGRPSSPGPWTAIAWPSSRAARSPAGPASSTRPAGGQTSSPTRSGGPIVGLTRDRLIAYGACRGLPCPSRLDRPRDRPFAR